MAKKSTKRPAKKAKSKAHDEFVATANLMMGLLKKKEDLLPELKKYRTKALMYEMISHPLFQCFVPAEGYFAQANYLYRQCQENLENYRRKKDFRRSVFCYTKPYLLKGFIEEIELASDKEYWNTLGEVWTTIESPSVEQKFLLELFSCPRPHRDHLMDADERRAFKKLPEQLTIYRGYSGQRGKGMSWTLDHAKAIWFAKRFHEAHGMPGKVIHGICQKSDVIAYFTGRGESEIVIDPAKVKRQKRVAV